MDNEREEKNRSTVVAGQKGKERDMAISKQLQSQKAGDRSMQG